MARRDTGKAVLLFMLALLLNSGGVALRTQDALSDKVIRLHVLANSDAPDEQALKLKVRDRILQETAGLLRTAHSRDEAQTALQAHLPELAKAAGETVSAHGYACPVTLELRETEFPTRDYGAFALPAGQYLSLQVVIGTGQGHNWWCVVFPPLCGAASVDTACGDFTAQEIGLMTRKDTACVLKFRAVECWETLRQKICGT